MGADCVDSGCNGRGVFAFLGISNLSFGADTSFLLAVTLFFETEVTLFEVVEAVSFAIGISFDEFVVFISDISVRYNSASPDLVRYFAADLGSLNLFSSILLLLRFHPMGFSKFIDFRYLQPLNAYSPIVVTLFGIVMLVRFSHTQNAYFPIEVTLFGIVMFVRLSQPLNTLSPIEVILFGIVMLVRFLQTLNAQSPIEVTLFGIVMFVRLSHPLNALSPIEVTLLGIVMLVRLLQTLNAQFPIESRLSGRVILVRFSHLENADFPIEVTLFGIVMFVRLSQPLNARSLIEVIFSGIMLLSQPTTSSLVFLFIMQLFSK